MVEEIDSSGHTRVRSTEQLFYGIVGHVRDRHGSAVDGWHQASQLRRRVQAAGRGRRKPAVGHALRWSLHSSRGPPHLQFASGAAGERGSVHWRGCAMGLLGKRRRLGSRRARLGTTIVRAADALLSAAELFLFPLFQYTKCKTVPAILNGCRKGGPTYSRIGERAGTKSPLPGLYVRRHAFENGGVIILPADDLGIRGTNDIGTAI